MPQFTVSGRDKIWRQVKNMFLGLDRSIQHMKLKKKSFYLLWKYKILWRFSIATCQNILFSLPHQTTSSDFASICQWQHSFYLSDGYIKVFGPRKTMSAANVLIGQNRCHLIYSDLVFTFTRGFAALIICLGSVPAINIQLIIFIIFNYQYITCFCCIYR